MYQEAFCTGNSFVVESSMKIDWAYQIVPGFNIKCDSLGNRWLTWIELFYFSFHSADVYMMKKCGNLGIGQVHRNQWNSAVYCTAPKNQSTRKLGKKKKSCFKSLYIWLQYSWVFCLLLKGGQDIEYRVSGGNINPRLGVW